MGYKCIDFPMLDNIISIYGIKTGLIGMKIFLFYFEMAIKITGSAQNYRVGRVSGNTPIFFKNTPIHCFCKILHLSGCFVCPKAKTLYGQN